MVEQVTGSGQGNLSSNQGNLHEKFQPVFEMVGKKVIDIAACGNFILAIAEEEDSLSAEETEEEEMKPRKRKRLYFSYAGPSTNAKSIVCAEYSKMFSLVTELSGCNTELISVGSTVRACVDDRNRLYTWGSNRSGALGHGTRSKKEINSASLVRLPHDISCTKMTSIDCTRGQPNPKNQCADPTTGQECPRIHLVTGHCRWWTMDCWNLPQGAGG